MSTDVIKVRINPTGVVFLQMTVLPATKGPKDQ